MGGGGSKDVPRGERKPQAVRARQSRALTSTSRTAAAAEGSKESLEGLRIDDSFACGPGCSLMIDSTITSSSLVLTRDILGKLEAADQGAPSDEWVWDDSWDLSSGEPKFFSGEKDWSKGNWYTFAKPGQKAVWANNELEAKMHAGMDLYNWKVDQEEHAKKRGDNPKQVYIWNPSDDGIVQMNTETYGALTKLFLKPTLPFKVSFNDGLGQAPEVNVTLISVFHPCPIRIDTVQYDAVMQIGDFRGLNGTECTVESDDRPQAVRALNKKGAIIARQIAEKEKERRDISGEINTFGATGTRVQELLDELTRNYAATAKLQARMNALELPTRRVCVPKDGAADRLVVFIPLKINDRAKSGPELAQTKFINTFANKIPSILGAQPDRYLGYPDVPAATQNDWKLSDVYIMI